MRLLHAWKPDAATFDDQNLVSAAALVPVLALAEQTQLPDLIDAHVRFTSERIASAAANPVAKVLSIIAGMLAGADSIADLQIIRSGGSAKLFGAVYAPSTLGMFLREFTHGHTRQLSAVLARHLLALTRRTGVLSGVAEQAFIDIDSLLRPVYRHAKQGASFGHTKIANRQVLRKGLTAGHHHLHRDRRAGDRRSPATGREGRVRARRRLHGHRSDQPGHHRRRHHRQPAGPW